MKKIMLLTAIGLITLVSFTTVKAEDNRTEERLGYGSGLIIGALTGGPVGAIIGAVSGAWIGDKINEAEKVEPMEQQIARNKIHLLSLQKSIAKQNQRDIGILFKRGMSAYAIGLFVWQFDLRYCELLQVKWPAWSGLPNPQFHAWWHVCVSTGFYFLITLSAYDRLTILGKEPKLCWFCLALPSLSPTRTGSPLMPLLVSKSTLSTRSTPPVPSTLRLPLHAAVPAPLSCRLAL